MRKKILLILASIPAMSVSLILSLVLYSSYSNVHNVREINKYLEVQAEDMLTKNGYQFYASLPQVLGSFSTVVARQDARPEILRQFLHEHNSPLADYALTIVDASDAYGVDFRLITAIGMCESNVGKHMPSGSYNAWGYAVYTGENNGAVFDDWEHGIRVMAEYLATKYYSQGLYTPEEIGPIYAPPSVQTGNSWAKCVRRFMDELR